MNLIGFKINIEYNVIANFNLFNIFKLVGFRV